MANKYKYMKEQTYRNHYEKYVKAYEGYKGKTMMKEGGKYNFDDFVYNFNNVMTQAELEGVKIDKYSLATRMAKSQQLHTDKQMRAMRAALQEEIGKKHLIGKTNPLWDELKQYGITGSFLYAENFYRNIDPIVGIFDKYVPDWNWRANIDT